MLGLGNSIASSGSISFDPSDISGLVANFNYVHGITLSGEFVTNWEDTTRSYNLAPEATLLRPTYSTAKGLIFAGGDAANGDRLELKDSGGDPTTITLDTSTNGFCIITQYASNNWDDGKRIIGEHGTSKNYGISHSSDANSFDFAINDTNKTFSLNTTTLTDEEYASIIFNSTDGGLTKLFVNSEEQSDNETFGNIDLSINQVGASDNARVLVGQVKNIIIYDKQLNAAELAQIESYLLPYR